MTQALLRRLESGDAGTFGELLIDGERFCDSLELPWRNNVVGLSCIPLGDYQCLWLDSPKWGWCFEVTGVPGRTDILMHRGNWAGDIRLHLKSDVEGCILLGRTPEILTPKPDKKTGFVYAPQRGITSSGPTIDAFHQKMAEESFMLQIRDAGAMS